MAYVALKPCGFAGQRFKIGDNIPAELVLPGAAKNLVEMGIIVDTDAAATPAKETIVKTEALTIALHTDDGDLPLEPSQEGIQQVFDALTGNVGHAETIIKAMTDGDALILLNAADSRKSIKEATEARAKELSAE